MADLTTLALSDDGPSDADPVEKREIVIRRVQYALKAAQRNRNASDISKLLLRAAEEIAGNNRQTDFLLNNADIIALLAGPERVQDVVFRRRAGTWYGAGHAHYAAILAGDPLFRGEARSIFRQAIDWLNEWCRQPPEVRREESIDDADIAALASVFFRLDGPDKAVAFLSSWKPRTISFAAGRILISSLIDAGQLAAVSELASSAKKNTYLLLAVAFELSKIGAVPTQSVVKRAVKLLLDHPLNSEPHDHTRDLPTLAAVTAVIEASAQTRLPKGDTLRLIEAYRPTVPSYGFYDSFDEDQRDPLLRVFSLHATLQNKRLAALDVAPESIQKALKDTRADHHGDARRFTETMDALLPWYTLRADVITGRVASHDVPTLIGEALKTTRGNWGHGAHHDTEFLPNRISKIWIDILIRSGTANGNAADRVKDWLLAQKTMIFIPTWTSHARSLARSAGSQAASSVFAVEARRMIDHGHMAADEVVDCYVKLARAIFPADRSEASSHFERALAVLERLGDEARDRWEALCRLAEKAGQDGESRPRDAYRFGRASEVIYEYASHKFPWDDAARAVGQLCPASGLAIVGRWRDRHKGWLGYTLPEVILVLLDRKLIAPGLAVAFYNFDAYWDLPDFVEKLLKGSTNEGRKAIFDNLLSHFERDGQCGDEIGRVAEVARNYGLDTARLDSLMSFGKAVEKSNSHAQPPHYDMGSGDDKPSKEVPWEEIIGSRTFLTPTEIDEAVKALEPHRPYWPIQELFQRIRAVVPANDRISHLRALVGADEIETWLLLSTLEKARADWQESLTVQIGLKEIVTTAISRRGYSFFQSWYSLDRTMNTCVELSGMQRSEIVDLLLNAAADSIDDVPFRGLYALARELIGNLESSAAIDVLRYELDRLERILKPEDGDGPWRPELGPPAEIPKAVSEFLWACLADPAADTRWRAAHAVRHLCRFAEAAVLDGLVSRLGLQAPSVFADATLPFYHLHARLFLLIAFARAAKDHPAVLRKYSETFAHYALVDSPHVLIRDFSANLALDLETAFPDTYSREVTAALKQVNISPFPASDERTRSSGPFHWQRSPTQGDPEPRYSFAYDFDRYWYDPLAEVFNIRGADVQNRAEVWILDRWGIKSKGWWNDDPRAHRRMYQERSNWTSHGSYPRVDDWNFYLSYHAMFCVAGELLAEKPVLRSKYDPEDQWVDWLNRHRLTRRDCRWLADRRDPVPLERRKWETENKGDDWRWMIGPSDFDDVLITTRNGATYLHVWGSRLLSDGSSREEVDISSALVSPDTSLSLISALQTAANSRDYLIPPAGDNLEIRAPGFKMTGWVRTHTRDRRFDKFDPFSSDIPYPPLRPSRAITRLFSLVPDDEQRLWRGKDGLAAFRAEIWGRWREDDDRRSDRHGRHLLASLDFVMQALDRLKRDLIFEVTIERSGYRKEEFDYATPPYARIYLLKADGTLHILDGSRRIGQVARQRTGP